MKERTKKLLNFAPFRVVYGIIAAIVMRLPRIAFFVLSFYAIFFVGQHLYYRYAPADHFLDFYYAKVDDTPIGTEALLPICTSRSLLQNQIRLLEAQIDALRAETGATTQTAPPEPSQSAPTTQDDTSTQSDSQNDTTAQNNGNSGNNSRDDAENQQPPQPTCIVPILGNSGLLCGGDGLLRL